MAKNAPIVCFKGFDKDFKCRGFQFEVGKTYEHDGKVLRCESGFHACEHPLHVFNYYGPADSRYALVEASGEISREENGDTKLAAARIHIKAEIRTPDLVAAAVKWVLARCEPANAKHSEGNRSASSATGNRSASSATGYRSASSANGKNAVAMNIGIHGKAKASEGGGIVLCAHDDDYNILHIRASKVGENGIKPDTYYRLDCDGNFVEAA